MNSPFIQIVSVSRIKRLLSKKENRRWLIGGARAPGGVPDQAGGRTRPQPRLAALARARAVPGAASGTSSGSAGTADQPSLVESWTASIGCARASRTRTLGFMAAMWVDEP